MPRRSPRNGDDDVKDSLAGEAVGASATAFRRNPRRVTKPVAYEDLQGAGMEDDEDVDATEEGSENADDVEEDEPLEADSEEEVLPRRAAKRKSDEKATKVGSPSRKSARTTKYSSSMAEPSETSEFLLEKVPVSDDGKKTSRKRGSDKGGKKNEKDDTKNMDTKEPVSPHKSPARRRAKKRHSIQSDVSDESQSDDSASDTDSEDEEDEEPLKVQRIIAARTERKSKWREICQKMNTSEVDNGSRWFQETLAKDAADADDRFEERFLIKWAGLSYLHCSWETRADLIELVEGAKTYLTTFFRKSQDGYLFGPDERNDGDYFDPAYTQIDRILDIEWNDAKQTSADEEAKLKPEDVGITVDKKDEKGTGREFLIKWGNSQYSESTWELERDLIWGDVDYKPHSEAFLRRNAKPSKQKRKEALKRAEQELRHLYKIFRDTTDVEEKEKAVSKYQQDLQEMEFKNGGKLRDYQAEGVAWMMSNYVNDRSSILADEMGLGKTCQTVTVANIISTKISPSGVFLVIAPLSTIPHWKREFESWTDLNTIVYHGSAEDRDIIRRYEMAFERDRPKRVAFNSNFLKKCGPSKYTKVDSPWMVQVIVTTPEMVTADDAAELMAIKYDMVIVDEAHRMKNRNSKLTAVLRDDRFSFGHKMLLTGTPIQNNVSEFWTLLNFCDDDKYDDLDDFLEKYGDMKDKETVDQLHDEIRPYILRRLKEDVEKSVPPKEETLIEVELTVPQKQYYRALYEKNVKFLYKNKTKALDGPSLNNLAMQLRKCCNHVCLLNGVEDELRRDFSETSEADFLVKGSGKLVLLDKLLPRLQEEGHRVLLFSQFKIMLDLIEDYLNSRGMKMERIDGSITGAKRQQAIDRFQATDAPKGSDLPFIMLLSTRAGGQGITLTAADTCIIFDSDWNPQNDLQAQARCHRIGQKSEVKVYRLISAKSYEMQMFHMSSMKMGLDQAVLKGFEKGNGTDQGMSKEEVERLLKNGAYDILNETKEGTAEAASNEFLQQDIDSILAGRSRKVVHENTGSKSGAAGGSFSKASFQVSKSPGKERKDNVEVDDPNFWSKILGEQHLKEDEDDIASKKRQRNQANYSEAAYSQQFEAAIIAAEKKSEVESDSEDDEEEDGTTTGRVGWGKKNGYTWDLKEAQAVADCLMAFGYGSLDWSEISLRLDFKDKGIDEIKRMAFSVILYCVIEATTTEIVASKKREDKLAEKLHGTSNADGEDDVNGVPVLQATDQEIEVAAFKKFWDSSADWVKKIVQDVVQYAKDNESRDHETLMHLLQKESTNTSDADIMKLFAANLWPSLRDRGWTASGLDGSSEQAYSYEDEKYNTIDEVLVAAKDHHSELSGVIESISNVIQESKKKSVEVQAEARQQILSLSASSATLSSIRETVEKFGPAQLVADRIKSHPSVRMNRKILSSCSLMASAYSIIQKAESVVENGTTIEKISKSLEIDARTSLPHPKWNRYHDSVLLYAITKHGWIESESSCRAIIQDKAISWGLPFGRSNSDAGKPSESTQIPPALLGDVADRACKFLNDNKKLLSATKAFNPARLVRTYWLGKYRPAEKGDTLADDSHQVEDFAVNREALLQGEAAVAGDLVELPTRKELQKRAKTLLSRATVSVNKVSGAKKSESPKKEHPYTILDQSHTCNIFLAQLIRGMMKAPAGSDLYKTMSKAVMDEISARLKDIDNYGEAWGEEGNKRWQQQRKDLLDIAENIDLAKRNMSKSVRLAKNVLRAILGEDPVQPKNPNESLYPVGNARLKVAPAKKPTTSPKVGMKRVDSKISSGEAAVAVARQKINSNKNTQGSSVDLTEVETAILVTASSFGIPEFKRDWRKKTASPFGMSWDGFGRHLVFISKTRMDESSVKMQKANRDYDSLEVKPNISTERRDTIERTCYLSERDYEAAEAAFGQSTDYSSEPETLAKKTILTLAKVSAHAGSKKSGESVGIRVWKWMSSQVKQWARDLDLLDQDGETLAYTAVDFLEQLPEAERVNVRAVAKFDAVGCAQIFGQVALLSRLRAFLGFYEGDALQARVEQALFDIQDPWPGRPAWWKESSALFDLLLLKRLAHDGFTGVLQTRSSYDITDSHAQMSYKASGVHKGPLQVRALQLVQSIHNIENGAVGKQSKSNTFFREGATGKVTAKKVIAIESDEDAPVAKKARVSA